MFDIFFLSSLFFFSLLCFFEIIVFNEEILLSVCFFSFIFFSFNAFGSSVFDIFQSRASKFEADLLISYNQKKQTKLLQFEACFASQSFGSQFKIFEFIVNNYTAVFIQYS